MKKIALFLMMMLGTVTSWARPGYTKPVDVLQPDGTTVTLLMRGDEYLSFMTTTDGYTVIKGDDGYYRYAVKAEEGLMATDFIAKNPEQRQAGEQAFLANQKKNIHADMSASSLERKARVSTMISKNYAAMKDGQHRAAIWDRINYDNFKGLVVLVEWNDRKFTMSDPQAFYQRLVNERHLKDTSKKYYPVDVTASARDYFNDQSMGIFDPTFDVTGPIQIDYSCEYPCPKTEDGKNEDPHFDGRFRNILKAVMTKLNSTTDFTNYDLNNDGTIDMVYLIFAGYGSYVQGNSYKYLWPHADDYSGRSNFYGMRYDGKLFGRYACSVEIQDYEGYASQHVWLDGIGTICHEFSHVLGLADHYDTDYENNGQAEDPGPWDIMAGGADYNYGLTPAGYNAFERYMLGFAELRTLDVEGSYELEPFGTSNQFYMIKTGTPNDDFFIENRQRQGWDTYLPGHGLLVWRAETGDNTVWSSNKVNCYPDHMYFQLLKATPTKSINSNYTPFPGAGKVTDITSKTDPALLSWLEKEAQVDLFDITENPDGNITFNAGKNLYESAVEDFEAAAVTTADAKEQKGVFCNWDLTNATIEQVADENGNGNQVVRIGRSGTLVSSPLTKPVRNLSFKAWNGSQTAKISLKYSVDDGAKWVTVKNTDQQSSTSLSRNEKDVTIMFREEIPANAIIQIQMLGTNTNAVTYIDDITVSFGKTDTEGIRSVSTSKASSAAYNLSGQRVTNGYKGVVIVNGKKTINH